VGPVLSLMWRGTPPVHWLRGALVWLSASRSEAEVRSGANCGAQSAAERRAAESQTEGAYECQFLAFVRDERALSGAERLRQEGDRAGQWSSSVTKRPLVPAREPDEARTHCRELSETRREMRCDNPDGC
jgi:hypothetical protein